MSKHLYLAVTLLSAFNAPALADQLLGDAGFRPRKDSEGHIRCLNENGQEGMNKEFIGPCGDLATGSKNYRNMVSYTLGDTDLTGFDLSYAKIKSTAVRDYKAVRTAVEKLSQVPKKSLASAFFSPGETPKEEFANRLFLALSDPNYEEPDYGVEAPRMPADRITQMSRVLKDDPFENAFIKKYFVDHIFANPRLLGASSLNIDTSGWNFPKDLSRIKLTRSEIEDSDFSFSNLSAARLAGATVKNSKFYSVNFRDAQLQYATFEETMLISVNFEEAKMQKSVFKNLSLSGARFSKANLRGISFVKANLKHANFYLADARDASFTESTLEGSFEKSDLRSASFEKGTINYSNFNSSNLSGATFKDLEMKLVDFQEADLRGAKFLQVKFIPEWEKSSYSSHSSLDGALGGSSISTSYSTSVLRSIDFRKADLRGADLSGISGFCASAQPRMDFAKVDQFTKFPDRCYSLNSAIAHGAEYVESKPE